MKIILDNPMFRIDTSTVFFNPDSFLMVTYDTWSFKNYLRPLERVCSVCNGWANGTAWGDEVLTHCNADCIDGRHSFRVQFQRPFPSEECYDCKKNGHSDFHFTEDHWKNSSSHRFSKKVSIVPQSIMPIQSNSPYETGTIWNRKDGTFWVITQDPGGVYPPEGHQINLPLLATDGMLAIEMKFKI